MIEFITYFFSGIILSILWDLGLKEIIALLRLRYIRRNWDKVVSTYAKTSNFYDFDGKPMVDESSPSVCKFACRIGDTDTYYYWVLDENGKVSKDYSVIAQHQGVTWFREGEDPSDFWEDLYRHKSPRIVRIMLLSEGVPWRWWHKRYLQKLSDETFILKKKSS